MCGARSRPCRTTGCAPCRSTTRCVPLPHPVRTAFAQHLRDFPAVAVTLPGNVHSGDDVTQILVVMSVRSLAVAANDFNRNYWKAALDSCDMPSGRYENGMHDLRHFFASKLLEQGVSIKAVAEWLGHTDPGE
jgi:integrase